ncbi:hypothetical protein F511_13750 [Dorcoceras hygrometricum]|uniref:CCHC-type domain-containing protein n=1 Tax=Dorcoceras hygrometricum TaxID=472368 RepID=A0A2Z7CKA9_9LAMI|nr:hypothetical protein F511_13750 [Dorcoceras hygrometricum]
MSLFVKKFGKYLRRSFNPYTSFNNYNKSNKVSRSEAGPSTSQPTKALAATTAEPCSPSTSKSADQLSDDVMSLFVKKFGKYLRRSFNPSTSFNNYNKSNKVSSELKCYNCDRPGHFAADCNRPKRDDRYKRDDRRADDRYRKEERYKRDEEDNERNVDRSKDKSNDKFKERSSDRKMKTSSNKRFSRKHDRKVLVAEESTKSWADSDSDSSSSSSSSSDSEQEEVHCFMADQTYEDEVFDFSNVEFTRDDLVIELNDMVKEYRKLSNSFEEAKAENMSLKSSSTDSSSDELEDTDILKTELSTLTLSNSSEMASSLISRSHHVDFDSVFRLDDAGIVQMFETLVSTGLMEFLGCSAIFHEQALIEFFENGSVRDGMVVSTISGTAVEISESVFAAAFGLPTEGLTDLSEVPRDLLSNAQKLFSASEKEVSTSCLKKEVKMPFRLLSDILAKSLFVKAGSFDAVTRDRFLLMTAIMFDVKVNWGNLLFGVLKEMVTPDSRQAKGYAIQICVLLKNIPGLELGESKAFPAPRILNEKAVHRIVSVNENVGVEEVGDAPRAKTTPVKRTVSKKRPASVDADVAPVIKKKRTTKSKPVAAKKLVLKNQSLLSLRLRSKFQS